MSIGHRLVQAAANGASFLRKAKGPMPGHGAKDTSTSQTVDAHVLSFFMSVLCGGLDEDSLAVRLCETFCRIDPITMAGSACNVRPINYMCMHLSSAGVLALEQRRDVSARSEQVL